LGRSCSVCGTIADCTGGFCVGASPEDGGQVSTKDGGTPDAGQPGDSGVVDAGNPRCLDSASRPDNLAINPGFECETGWAASVGQLSAVADEPHGGQRAARLITNSAGDGRFASITEVETAATAGTYCIMTWARGTAPGMKLEVITTPSNVVSSTVGFITDPGTWSRIPPSTNLAISASKGDHLYVIIRTNGADAGDVLYVDDVDLWKSNDGTCTSRP
jgi:hypothetical protein